MEQRADKRKYHYIYKTTCLMTSHFYVGMHSTDKLGDDYRGSGKRLSRSIKKCGRENHRLEILEFLPTREALRLREREIVNEDLLKDSKCQNLRLGGDGWESKEASKAASLGNRSPNRDHKAAVGKALATKKARGSGNHFGGKHNSFEGKSHTEETRKKIGKANSLAQLGERNSQFGSCWVTDGVKPIKIKKEQLDEYLKNGYSKGRKIWGQQRTAALPCK